MPLAAQSRRESHIGLAANVGKQNFASALSWSHEYGLGKSKRFKIGYGLRLTSFWGVDQDYITAPAKFTSGKESFAALFTENIAANLDTVRFPRAQFNSVNAVIYLAYTLPFAKDKLDLGVNIDAIGFSFGSQKGGVYRNSSVVNASPTRFNILLISDSDRGTLNSEWYIRYWISQRWAVKVGYEFLFTEYTTEQKIQTVPGFREANDRFRNKSSMLMVGVQFAPFR
jgi:hypothetical protein